MSSANTHATEETYRATRAHLRRAFRSRGGLQLLQHALPQLVQLHLRTKGVSVPTSTLVSCTANHRNPAMRHKTCSMEYLPKDKRLAGQSLEEGGIRGAPECGWNGYHRKIAKQHRAASICG